MLVKFLLFVGIVVFFVVVCQFVDDILLVIELIEVIFEEWVWDKGIMVVVVDFCVVEVGLSVFS